MAYVHGADETFLFIWLWSSQYQNMHSFGDHTLGKLLEKLEGDDWKNVRGWVLLLGMTAKIIYQGTS